MPWVSREGFHWADYVVFTIILLISLFIGSITSCIGKKQTNKDEFVMGGKYVISNYYSYYYRDFIYLSSTILYYANHVTLSVRRHSSIELWRMRLISVSK